MARSTSRFFLSSLTILSMLLSALGSVIPAQAQEADPTPTPDLTPNLSANGDFVPSGGISSPGPIIEFTPINDGGFENGPPPASAWTEVYNPLDCSLTSRIIDPTPYWSIPARSGTYAWWGGGYCGATPNPPPFYVEQSVSVPVSEPLLTFYTVFYRPNADDVDADLFDVTVNGDGVFKYDLIQANDTYPNWTLQTVDLSAYAGETVNLRFEVISAGVYTGNVLVDDIGFGTPGGLPNDDFDYASLIDPLPYTDTLDTTNATIAADDPVYPCGSGDTGSETVWYQFTPQDDATLHADTFTSNFDTMLALWTGTRGNLTNVACNDDFGGGQSQIEAPVQAGVTYFLEVADYSAVSTAPDKFKQGGDRYAPVESIAGGNLHLFVDLVTASQCPGGPNSPLFTTQDNQNNAESGVGDCDMDVYLFNDSPIQPIEFTINVPDASGVSAADLLLLNWDIDETSGEVDEVYFNGNYAGALTGADSTWSTTALSLDPAWVVTGDNLVRIDIDVNNPGYPTWAVTIDWGQLVLNSQGGGTAFIRTVTLDQPTYAPGGTVHVDVEVDTTLTSQDVHTEINLLDPSGVNIDGAVINHTVTDATDDPVTTNLDIPVDALQGTYDIQVLVYDLTSGLFQDSEVVPFDVVTDPDIDVSPTSFDVTLEVGGTTSETLTIANVGGGTLTFDITEQQIGGSSTPGGNVLWDTSHGIYLGYSPSNYFSDLTARLASQGYTIDENASGVLSLDLSDYDIVVLNIGSAWYSPYSEAEAAAIQTFVSNGGGLIIGSENTYCPNANLNPVSQLFGTTGGTGVIYDSINNLAAHPIFSGLSELLFNGGGSLAASAPSEAVAWDSESRAGVSVATYGSGRVVVIGDINIWDNGYLNKDGSDLTQAGAVVRSGINAADNHLFADKVFAWVNGGGGGADVPWLSEDPTSGSVGAGGSQAVTVGFDASALAVGDYTANLVIGSNDPDENPLQVPVTLHVVDASEISLCPGQLPLDATLPPGASETQPLCLQNTGTSPLDFSILEQGGGPLATELSFPKGVKIEPGLGSSISQMPGGMGRYLVYLKDQANLSHAYSVEGWDARGQWVYETLRSKAKISQVNVLSLLETLKGSGSVKKYQSFWVVNAILVEGDLKALNELAAHKDVAYIEAERQYELPPESGSDIGLTAIEWGVAKINAPAIWNDLGDTGQGVVVANIDTGVDFDHPALAAQYRGTATGSHDYNWFDPSAICPGPYPCDNHNHGTHTMGTMVGDDGAGNQIGVAPGAQWIAAKGCESGSCSGAALLASGQWMLAPTKLDGSDADPAMRPNVINNSWGGGSGDLWYQATIIAWRAADIFPAFAAGNDGPGAGSISSPGDNPEAFAVGATDSGDSIAGFSGRGPSPVDPGIKPDVSAPGVNIRSAVNGGGYQGGWNGTSMATPHVAGCVALLMSFDPGATIDEIEEALRLSAVDLGAAGPDYDYGYGRIDCRAAADLLGGGGADVPWLDESPTSGTLQPGGIISVDVTFTANPPSGDYTADLLVTGNTVAGANVNNTLTIPAHLLVTEQMPDIVVSPDSFEVTLPMGETTDETLTIGNEGDATLDFEIAEALEAPSLPVSDRGNERTPIFANLPSEEELSSILPGSPEALALAMGVSPTDLISASIITSDPLGTGIGDSPLSYFPTEGSNFTVLSSGLASSADSPNNSGSLSTILGGLNNVQGNDMVQLFLELQVPVDRDCLNVDFAFYSEEFPEWVGSNFNDTFTAEYGGTNLIIDGNNVIAPLNFAFDTEGQIISVNTVFGVSGDTGTTYDGATPLLHAKHAVPPGVSILVVFTVQDLGDSVYDSAVFLDNFHWTNDQVCSGGSQVDIPWLSENPTSGSVGAGDSQAVTVGFDASALAVGDYTANLVIGSNDPDENPLTVPVTLHVINPVPQPPTNVQASDGTYTDKVQVTWNASSGATYYQVYRATSAIGSKGLLDSPTGTDFNDTTATPRITYYYWVMACNGAGCSDYSIYNTGWRELPPPTNVQASDGTYTNKVLVSWNASSGATSYKVYRATSATGTKSLLGSPTGTTFDDTTATTGVTYTYWVKACKGANCSGFSAYDTGWRNFLPLTNVQASDGTYTDKVQVTWNAASGATSYQVYRATSAAGTKSLLGSPTGTQFNDTSATPGVLYYYWVKACNGTNCSSFSAYDTGWRKPTAPTNVQASDGTYTDKVQVSWNASSGATSYKVYRAASATGTKSLLGSPTGTSFNDTTAMPGITYTYWVMACRSSRCSSYSAYNTGWRKLSAPANVQASNGTYTDKVLVTWNSSSGATSYKVYRAASATGTKSLRGSPTGTSFNDTTATPNVTYYYWVMACRGSQCSSYSAYNTGWRRPSP